MGEQTSVSQPLSRADASRVLTNLGWRYMLGVARTTVRTGSMRGAADAAASIVQQCGQEADGRLLIDIRDGYLILTVRGPASGFLTADEAALVRRVSAIVTGLGLRADPLTGSGELRSVQMLEIAIDAMDIASIRPFWRAVLGYLPERGRARRGWRAGVRLGRARLLGAGRRRGQRGVHHHLAGQGRLGRC